METALFTDLYHEHVRPVEEITSSVGIRTIQYTRYCLCKCVDIITSGTTDPMYEFVLGVGGLCHNHKDKSSAENFIVQCDYFNDKGIGLGIPEQYAINLNFYTRLMTTNGVQLLKNQRMRSVQTGYQYKEKSKSNHGNASTGLDENESIEGI